MNELKSNIQQSLRNCLSKLWNKQFLIFLFFLLLSSAFWLFQALNEIYEKDFKVKVNITNVPEGAIITTEAVPEIDMTLRDRGVNLLNYKYGLQFKPLVIDYNTYSNPSGHVRVLTKELLKQLNSQIATSTQVISTKPDTVEFYYNHGLHKRIPVVLEGEVNTENGYTITNSKLSLDSVTVYAASSILEEITEAHVKVDYLQNISSTTTMPLKISKVRGAKFIPSQLNFEVEVDRLVEKKLQVPIQAEGFPANLLLLPIPQETEVIFQVGMNRYKEISADDFVVVAKYSDMPKNGAMRYPLRLKSAPQDVTRTRLVPSQVEYIVEKVIEDKKDDEEGNR